MARSWLLVVVVLGGLTLLLFRGEAPILDDGVVRRERIVSLAPNLTQVVQLLGRGDDIVGVTSLCPNVPDEVARVGDRQVDFERIVGWVMVTLVRKRLTIETDQARLSIGARGDSK